MTDYEHMAAGVQHLQFAGLLAGLFAVVTLAYLAAVGRGLGSLPTAARAMLHTLFYLWQSNVAYLAVVTLRAGRISIAGAEPAAPALGWHAAPWMVPGAAVLYASVLLLCIAFAVARGRAAPAS